MNSLKLFVDNYIFEYSSEFGEINKSDPPLLIKALHIIHKLSTNTKDKTQLQVMCSLIKNFIINSEPAVLNKTTKYGCTALMMIAACSLSHNIEQFLQILIDAGVDINLQSHCSQKNVEKNINALMLAVSNYCLSSSENTLQILIKSGANLNLQAHNGTTALMLAIKYNYSKKLIKILIDAGADLNLQNNDGQTALDIFLIMKKFSTNDSIFKLFVECKAKINYLKCDNKIKKEIRMYRKKFHLEKMKLECSSVRTLNDQLLNKLVERSSKPNICMIKDNITAITNGPSYTNKKKRTIHKLKEINKYLQIELECHPGSIYLKYVEERFDRAKNN